MKVKVRLSSTRKFILTLEDETLGALKAQIRKFVLEAYQEDVREPLAVSLNGTDPLAGGDDVPLASLGVVPGDMLTVLQPRPGQQAPPSATPPQVPPAPKECSKPKPEQKEPEPPPATLSAPTATPTPVKSCGVTAKDVGEQGPRELLMEAVDGTAPRALEELLGQCGPVGLSGTLNLVLHLTMLECGFQLDGVPHPPPGWAETVAVFPYRSTAHPAFRCKLVLMDVGWNKQVMASFPEQDGEVKHSLAMADHLRGPASGHVVAKDLVKVAQLSQQLRDAVLLPLQVAAHQALGVPAPWHLAGLPQELVLAVAAMLDYRSVVALASTCRRLQAVLADDRLWRSLYRRDFPGQKEGATPVGANWQTKYRQAELNRRERKRVLDEGHFVVPGVYPNSPFLPSVPGHPNPFNPRPNPFLDPDSPYFQGEVPHVPGVYPDMPDPLGPLGPGGPLGPLHPGHPRQPPFIPGRPRNPRGPRFDFFM
ncbi:F-box only protein 7-like [Portunus trituberculatus]|uniref:F-box only protein 7 n=1 Tax=Portunus trituberculatus TaxID=210409 RepID=A0A5B7F9B1_PORTR|nr:F-box only protein 7-like [Portunus trituberculatus]MPC44210.1 F-box only protein 7 [Portunus trituberculatus]